MAAIAADVGCLLASSHSLDDTLPILDVEKHPMCNYWRNIPNVRSRVLAACVKFDQRLALERLYIGADNNHLHDNAQTIYDTVVAHKRFITLIYLLERNAIARYLIPKYAQWVCRFPREAMHVMPSIRDHYPAEYMELRPALYLEVSDRAKKQTDESRRIRHTQLMSLLS